MFELTAPPKPAPTAKRRVRCDERCRYARGPDCNCKCGGARHGEAYRSRDQIDLFSEGKQ